VPAVEVGDLHTVCLTVAAVALAPGATGRCKMAS
jgi:hypothetical protein